MQDTDKVQALVQKICDALNLAAELDIDIRKEMDVVGAKILKVSSAADAADLKMLRAAFRPLSSAVQ
jgi:hypothetical protein